MTREDYDNIEQALQDAEKSDTPFLIASDDEIVVAGDANKTELNMHDIEVKFRVVEEIEGKKRYVTKTKEFKDVYITPRRDPDVVKALTAVLPFFKKLKVDERGNLDVATLTEEEKAQIYNELTDEVYDAMYDVVAAVLQIDPVLKEYMEQISVIEATAKIISCFGEVVNESDTFFGLSSVNQ